MKRAALTLLLILGLLLPASYADTHIIQTWGDIDEEYGFGNTTALVIFNNGSGVNTTLHNVWDGNNRSTAVGDPDGTAQTHTVIFYLWGDFNEFYIWDCIDEDSVESETEVVSLDSDEIIPCHGIDFDEDEADEVEETNATQVDTTNATITNICPCDNYVFVGRTEYVFRCFYKVNVTTYTAYELSMNFTDDAGNVYVFVYNASTGRTTVTSPNDAVSGAGRGLTSYSGNDLKIDFYVMFHEPVADTVNTSVYLRAETSDRDTGWEDSDYDFSIYNIGGKTTDTFSGTAGRLTGGEGFEIYAGDTNTKVLISNENFDVRKWPGVPGFSIYDEEMLLDDLTEWDFYFYERVEDEHTIFPTNIVPTGYSSMKTFNSRPYGLRFYSYDHGTIPDNHGERQFSRAITAANDEMVNVTFYAMNPSTSNSSGMIGVTDESWIEGVIGGGSLATIDHAVVFFWGGNGSIGIYNGTTEIYPASYVGGTWYNYTFWINMTAQTYDFYVDGVLNETDVNFYSNQTTSIEYIRFSNSNTAPTGYVNHTHFFIDDLFVETDFDGNYGGYAEAKTVHRNLQHWHMSFDWAVEDVEFVQGPSINDQKHAYIETFEEEGYVMLGWDVCIDGTWQNNILYANVTIKDGLILKKDSNWVLFNIDWYNYTTKISSETLYGLFEGWTGIKTDEGGKNVIGWHWDIWFNLKDYSTWIGARLNTEWYGMKRNYPGWMPWVSDWNPAVGDRSYSDAFTRLRKSGSSTIESVKEVDLVRSWVYVYRTNVSTFHYKIQNIEGESFQTATEMQGVDTPPLIATKTPQTPGGFMTTSLGAIFKRVIDQLSASLTYGLMSLWGYFAGFLNTLAAWAGAPDFFTNLFTWISSFATWMGTAMGWALTYFADIFTFSGIVMSRYLSTVGTVLTQWGSMFTVAIDLFGNAYTSGLNLWTDLGGIHWLRLAAIMYPVYLLYLWEQRGIDAVINNIRFIMEGVQFFIGLFLAVAQFAINLVVAVIDSIPVIE